MKDDGLLPYDWACPPTVRAVTTLRCHPAGASRGDYANFNLAAHVGDRPDCVEQNRRRLHRQLALPSEPLWLRQTHGAGVHRPGGGRAGIPEADAAVSGETGQVCAVLTADCLPVFFCNRQGTEVAVAHAGWRGLFQGVLEATIAAMHSATTDLMVCLGPAIGPARFEVGLEVYRAFTGKQPRHENAFVPLDDARFLCDLYRLAENILTAAGIGSVAGGGYCTFSEPRFFSYRRSAVTGRMASLIWIES